jgi:peptidoglycan/xylan/chitin deacetylase (PgdA/CDA1 family)
MIIHNFLFHRVHPERDPLWDPMDPALFEKCIKRISNQFDVVRIEDYVLEKESYRHQKIATIQFDDGYKDNLYYAAPIMEKYNVKASLYVVTDCIDHNVPTWTHILEHLFLHTRVLKFDTALIFLPNEYRFQHFGSKKEQLDFAQRLKAYLKTIDHLSRSEVMNSIEQQYHDVELPELMMDWNDIRQLSNAGHYIGSHTQTHAMLGTIKEHQLIKNELVNSQKRIENELGYIPLSISYPVGSYNKEVIELSKQAGYKLGLAVKQYTYDPETDNDFEIPRIELYNEAWWKTKLRISNQLELIKKRIGYRK